ncbi:MAG: acylneuraminate cytidylyltransferase family protein [Rhodospirillaceae bacterium]|jgi:CMP-N-acetylneuraminic acid synthetase|nr:acylneuraminate cytidylyltransferase family protein [Rhodospirillaceae bacterium]MBT4043905.1 acylneuraminate cytidylyltransferase family protein [Rhodospirillaceae bacterium]MBT4689032.1 acylneuraminate cytidylyltransferase family protein [Rhodospirillaceae bacterium]MBT5082143.1 acylneuraminate cytidylyltransferase family protein [Rhodospirillaceae bacterium]MBT5523616.1 acylneuraminate cytidylyltransferase family protein [Rhodospirillaceae bacterium]
MKIIPNAVWGLIPARGGSKSIPMKNLTPFVGRPLIDFQVLAANGYGEFSRLLCSTDNQEIADRCATLRLEVHSRPINLGSDNTPVIAVVEDLMHDLQAQEGAVAEYIAILHPTSPFVLPEHIRWAINALLADGNAASAQTVVPCPRHHHANAQRQIMNGEVHFNLPEFNTLTANLDAQARHYAFGNFVVMRSQAALEQQTIFPTPSIPIEIPFAQGFDLETADDVKLGQALLAAGLAELPNS